MYGHSGVEGGGFGSSSGGFSGGGVEIMAMVLLLMPPPSYQQWSHQPQTQPYNPSYHSHNYPSYQPNKYYPSNGYGLAPAPPTHPVPSKPGGFQNRPRPNTQSYSVPCTCGKEKGWRFRSRFGRAENNGSDTDGTGERILGGTRTTINKYPWIVSIKIDKNRDNDFSVHCGGTLVASKYVITASNCVWSKETRSWMDPRQLQLTIGDHYLMFERESALEAKVAVSRIMGHENYDPVHNENDIAVLELATEVKLTSYTPACLPRSNNYDFAGVWAKVYGWGVTSPDKGNIGVHYQLMEVDVPVVGNAFCSQVMPHISPGKLCAGGQLNKDACTGDSGGPLTYVRNNQHILIGDVSYGEGCGQAGKFGIYGRISYFRDWIDTKMPDAKFCFN